VASGGEDEVRGVASGAEEEVAAEMTVALCVADDGLDSIAAAPLALDGVTLGEAWCDHYTVVATVAQVLVDLVTIRTGLVGQAQPSPAPSEPRYHFVECHRRVWDLIRKPHLTIPASLGHADGNRRFVHVQPDEGDMLSHGPSPVLRPGAGPSGATLDNPAQFEAGHPASDGHLVQAALRRCSSPAADLPRFAPEAAVRRLSGLSRDVAAGTPPAAH
jgi:hypothetical protein